MAHIEAKLTYVDGGVVELGKGAAGVRALMGEAEVETLYVFSNRLRDLLKFLILDANGVWCGTRQLHHRRFIWPESPAGRQRLPRDELVWLIAGGDAKKWARSKLLLPLRT